MRARKTAVRRGTRFERSGKMVPDRRIYVSWLESKDSLISWKEEVYNRFLLETGDSKTGGSRRSFSRPLQTGDAEAGVIKKQWLGSLMGGVGAAAGTEAPITDIVGVCTVRYLNANTGRLSEDVLRELEEFFEARARNGIKDSIRVWLAPLERAKWQRYTVCDIGLADPDGSHREWLYRLKADNDRYTWPSEKDYQSSDEIEKLVETIIGTVEE